MVDDDSNWGKQLLMSLGVLVAISLVIGGIVSLMALGAADVAGVAGDDAQGSASPPEQSLYIPPTPTASEEPAEPESPAETETAAPEEPSESKKVTPKPRRQIILQVSPKRASIFERINLTGSYRGGNGATLQVQRDEGRWVDFPTSATVQGGTFATYVETGRAGKNRFRVIDESTGRASKPVSVTVR